MSHISLRQHMVSAAGCFLLATLIARPGCTTAFARPLHLSHKNRGWTLNKHFFASSQTVFESSYRFLSLRGGAEEGEAEPETSTEETKIYTSPAQNQPETVQQQASPPLAMIAAYFATMGKHYGAWIDKAPILTKSITAAIVFGLSDYLAQRFEARGTAGSDNDDKKKKKAVTKYNWTRTWTNIAVGFGYFGPAAHYWYEGVFAVFPGSGMIPLLQKTVAGQLIFGPAFTCLFFATNLWQSGQWSLSNWFAKIRKDLKPAWLAGIGFWPIVDLISYSLIPLPFIPLFVNMCSLVWTIYLSIIANRAA